MCNDIVVEKYSQLDKAKSRLLSFVPSAGFFCVKDIVKASGLPHSTVHNYLRLLEKEKIIVRMECSINVPFGRKPVFWQRNVQVEKVVNPA